MATLIPISDLVKQHGYDLQSDNLYDPTGQPAYGSDGRKIGTVREALADPTSGKLRSLVVDAGGWFSSKEVVVPVGLARVEDDGVYFDTLTKDQVGQMQSYTQGADYDDNARMSDERVLRGSSYSSGYSNASNDTMTTGGDSTTDRDLSVMGTTGTTGTASAAATTSDLRDDDALYKTPNRLQLLEERLSVNKDRYQAGSVEIGKHVETRQQQVSVDLTHEEVVIERRPVNSSQPVAGNVTLGAASETIRVDLEAERASVGKQAYVTEEVEIGKRTETETRTFTESVGREVLDVSKTGDVDVSGADTAGTPGRASTQGESLLEKGRDAVTGAVDKLEGKNNKR